ncbi:MAG: UDP-glucuronosyltransferase [Nitrosopumilus sp. H8]|nr:MAG: UDP-glucuronosyltransferase [Nitrosopumilus sp. H8]
MKVCFFSSPIGLGHVTRDIAIAEYLDVKPSFVTGGGAARLLQKLGMDVRDVYTPPPFSTSNGTLQNQTRWLWEYYRYYRDCKGVAQKIITDGRPDVIVSDEDFASLAVAQDEGIPSVLITDILETRFTGGLASLVEKKMNKSMRSIMQKCDLVILPEHGKNHGNTRRVGPIVRKVGDSRDGLRKKFSFGKKTIVVSIGGTDAGVFLIEAVLRHAAGTDADVVIVSGPEVTKKFPGAQNMGFVENLHEVILAADVLVSLAGRSTIDEARAYGTPAIFIPIRGHFEQEDNAKREGFAHGDIGRLGELLAEKLQEGRGSMHAGGAETAAGLINHTVGSNA